MPKGSNKPYICAYRENIEAAARDLTPVAFKLYLYFVSNQNNYKEAFSSQHFADTFGCNVKSAKEAFNALISKGYLVLEEGRSAHYCFYEIPQAAIALPAEVSKKLKKKSFLDVETGTQYEWTFEELLLHLDGDEETAKSVWEAQ